MRFVGSADAGQSTIGGEIRRLAELQPDRVALVATGFAPLSYRELHCLTDEMRNALRLAGFSRDARIAISMPDGPQAALAIVAVACSAVSVPLNPKLTLREIESCFAAIRPDAVLMVKGADSPAKTVAERVDITIIELTQSKEGQLAFGVAEVTARAAASPDESSEPDADGLALILQTSGTSAKPKLIPISHRNVLVTAARVQAWYNLTPYDRCLGVSPVFYAHGLKVTVFPPLLTGGSVAFPKDASKFDFAEWFGSLKPTWYSAGPTLHRLLFDQIESWTDAEAGHSLRFVTAGLALLPAEVQEGLQRTLGVPVLACCGASEASVIASNEPPPGRAKLGTVGIPWPDTVIIVGEDGARLPPGRRGEIWVSGPTVIAGYLNAPELNRVSFADGWFKTDDIGSLDEDGFLTLHGRKDDLINRGGEKISPLEIDDALMRHPAIDEAAAFAVPHSRLGEDVAAAVVLRPGMNLKIEELRSHLQKQLASFKIPRRIVIRDHLPKGQTGKVLRRQLAELIEEDTAEIRTDAPQGHKDLSVNSTLVMQITEIWERLLKIAPLSPGDDFFEKGGDSLLAMEMLVELELLTGRTILKSILFDAPTIGQLAQALSSQDQIRRRSLVQLNSNGCLPPLFYFHGDFNWPGYSAIRLAKLLGSDQPLWVVDPSGMANDPVPRSIEAMAADRLPLIMEAQPKGPYRLFGYCIGGIVAFEVARMLVAAGQKVDIVIMMDSPTIGARRSVQLLLSTMRGARSLVGPIVDHAMAWTFCRCAELQKFWNVSWTRRWTAIRKKLRNLATLCNVSSAEESLSQRSNAELNARHARAMSNYVPKPLTVRVIYFSIDFDAEVWRKISPDLEIVKSPGDHYDYDFAYIARYLQARLRSEGV
jgi:oxalate---CoA ligase